jgi:hypothetical protein
MMKVTSRSGCLKTYVGLKPCNIARSIVVVVVVVVIVVVDEVEGKGREFELKQECLRNFGDGRRAAVLCLSTGDTPSL